MRALEFYSGIGGMHYGLLVAKPDAEVVAAFDIDNVANDVYQHNFGRRPHQCNIEAITRSRLDKLAADLWMMAPPCQPYTRRGLQKGHVDARAASFMILLGHLHQMKQPPTCLLLENVVGFEASQTHADMMQTLVACNYMVQEFLLSPIQFGVPYSRPRYFALARRCNAPDGPPRFALDQDPPGLPHTEPPFALLELQQRRGQTLPPSEQDPDAAKLAHGLLHLDLADTSTACVHGHEALDTVGARITEPPQRQVSGPERSFSQPASELVAPQPVQPIINFLLQPQAQSVQSDDPWSRQRVPEALLEKAGAALDIVAADARRCNCFTSTYGRYIKGSGSVLATANLETLAYTMVPRRGAAVQAGEVTSNEPLWHRIAVPSACAGQSQSTDIASSLSDSTVNGSDGDPEASHPSLSGTRLFQSSLSIQEVQEAAGNTTEGLVTVVQTTVTSLLLAESDLTGNQPVIQYTSCQADPPVSIPSASPIAASALGDFTVASRFFGTVAAQLSDFRPSCSGVALKQAEVSVASSDFQCPCGTPTDETEAGQQLVIGLQGLVYNKAYDSCVPNATADYRLPDLKSREPDYTVCAADPFNLTGFGMPPDASIDTSDLQLSSSVETAHCFAVNYTGWLVVKNNSDIQFFGTPDNSLYNKFKASLFSSTRCSEPKYCA
ncbi:hypothetical protein WJX84_004189 [Apatococcus fuscideae]|uniref:Uncharacterized protein n=1 Tax=Apatococcus fuscideae TaxID=2026836 RepID=A0AAW1SVC4_9CHLO